MRRDELFCKKEKRIEKENRTLAKKGRALPMTGRFGPSCGGSCRLRRPCRPALAAATDGGASSRWASIICQRSALVLVVPRACPSSSSSRQTRAGPSSTLRADNRRRTHLCSISNSIRTMNSKKSPSSPFRASNLASSPTAQPDRPWPMDPESFQVNKFVKKINKNFSSQVTNNIARTRVITSQLRVFLRFCNGKRRAPDNNSSVSNYQFSSSSYVT